MQTGCSYRGLQACHPGCFYPLSSGGLENWACRAWGGLETDKWGPAVCIGILGKMAKSRRRTPVQSGENHVFSLFFSRYCWSKPIPKPPENPSDHFEPVSASLDHSQPILHRFYIFDFCLIFSIFGIVFEVVTVCFLFLELRRLWDHSQLVDLIFLIWMVSTRASESSETHS